MFPPLTFLTLPTRTILAHHILNLQKPQTQPLHKTCARILIPSGILYTLCFIESCVFIFCLLLLDWFLIWFFFGCLDDFAYYYSLVYLHIFKYLAHSSK